MLFECVFFFKPWFTLSLSLFLNSFSFYAECLKGNSCLTYCTFCHEIYGKNSMDCLDILLNLKCFKKFMNSMEQLNSTDHCEWRNVNG